LAADTAADPLGVTVIVVNHDGGGHVLRCLECLAALEPPPERIVVIDNASTDGSAAAAREAIAASPRLACRTTFHDAGANLGFAAANNLAVSTCTTEFVALLNPDAFPAADWLARLVAAARRHPEAAAFGSRQFLAEQPGLLDGVGDAYHISGLSWREGHGCPPAPADDVEREIFSPCAAAALYRRAAFLEVGGFDDDFFCYFEDVDLGFRLRLAGYRAIYVPDALVWHRGGGSSAGKNDDFAVYHGHRNLVWCFVKNMPAPLFYPLLIAHLSQSILSAVFLVTRSHFASIVRSKRDAVLSLRKFWRKRRIIQAQRRASAWTIWKALHKGLSRRRCRIAA
jgi:GT2 family glycosyltransferase